MLITMSILIYEYVPCTGGILKHFGIHLDIDLEHYNHENTLIKSKYIIK